MISIADQSLAQEQRDRSVGRAQLIGALQQFQALAQILRQAQLARAQEGPGGHLSVAQPGGLLSQLHLHIRIIGLQRRNPPQAIEHGLVFLFPGKLVGGSAVNLDGVVFLVGALQQPGQLELAAGQLGRILERTAIDGHRSGGIALLRILVEQFSVVLPRLFLPVGAHQQVGQRAQQLEVLRLEFVRRLVLVDRGLDLVPAEVLLRFLQMLFDSFHTACVRKMRAAGGTCARKLLTIYPQPALRQPPRWKFPGGTFSATLPRTG